jgi:hypothetical protein
MEDLLAILKERFEKNMHRHPKVTWVEVEKALRAHPAAAKALEWMEESEGEPDIVGASLWYVDCSAETPKGRRSFCYDHEALENRKEHKPKDSAMNLAEEHGTQLLTEQEYLHLQEAEEVDLKTSSWLLTPEDIRAKGGALFGDKRFGRVFIYHNGAESYYAARGFRVSIRL